MRIPTRAITSTVGISLTPLIDVVLLLILFFLLSGHLARQETQLAVPLPAAQSGQQDAVANRASLTINVLADGALLVANRSVTIEELAAVLAQRRNAHGDSFELRIRADQSVPYSRIELLIRACSRANVTNITFAVTPLTTHN